MQSAPISRSRNAVLSVLLLAGLHAGLLASGGTATRAQEGGFVAEVADLPLMPGLVEVADAGVVFDKPDGRIVEAYAEGAVERAAVLAFYGGTLPQLGWRQTGTGRFRREGENLALDFLDGGGPLIVRFTLTPE